MELNTGQVVRLMKGDTTVTGRVNGYVYQDDNKELERIYIVGIANGFWISEGWYVATIEKEGN